MILTVGNIKGGVGKTLLAVNIAVARAHRCRDVLLIDGDDQASAATFATIRGEIPGGAMPFTTIRLEGAAIRQEVKRLRANYSEIVIDSGGRDSGSLRAALTVADVALVPFQPRSVDLWVAAQMAALIADARTVNEGLRAVSILNVADVRGQDNADALQALRAIEGIEPLPCAVARRKVFPNAFSNGLGVIEQLPHDRKAIEELLSVVDALYTQKVYDVNSSTTQRKAV